MPIGDVFVRDSRCDVEHDNAALPLDVISITETTKLLLARSIPDVETNGAEVGRERERMDFNAKRSWR
jgi:hypothetical protein